MPRTYKPRPKHETVCEECSKTYEVWHYNTRFCSDACRQASYRKGGSRPQRPNPVDKFMRLQVFERDDYRCVYCGWGRDDDVKLEPDHLIPLSKGGETTMANVVTACHDCNAGKRDRILTTLPPGLSDRLSTSEVDEG